jgi:U3 small nucleolar RNA-associated protein 21
MDEPAPVAEVSDGDEVDLASERLPSQERVAPEEMKLEEGSGDSKAPPTAKEEGLITLSGLPPSHWKNLFHLELVKERNKPKEAPKKPPSAPFFLQWRSGEALGGEPANENTDKTGAEGEANDEEEWAAAWSDEDDGKAGEEEEEAVTEKRPADTQETAEVSAASAAIASKPKKRKLTHHRSHLAALLDESFVRPQGQGRFQAVTDHVATLGPSAIDVSLSTLCNGMHDLEDGLPLLHKASLWLLEACQSGQRYEAVNAYLHRFLYLHATVLAGIEDSMPIIDQELSEEEQEAKRVQSSQRRDLLETISELKRAQRAASDGLREKMQQSLCLLRHFSRMV